MNALTLRNLLIEHLREPVGPDCVAPRFCWELSSENNNVMQTAYRIPFST